MIPEYCKLEEADVVDHAFDLIFAFDEIVALGYRENVNLAQESLSLLDVPLPSLLSSLLPLLMPCNS